MDAIETGVWRILMKGTYRYGYYYKTVGTTTLEKAKQMFDEINGWKYVSQDGTVYETEITKDFETFNNEMLASML